MIVGGILICVGLLLSGYKTNAYVAWVEHKTAALTSKLAAATQETHETVLKETPIVDEVEIVDGGV